MPSEFEYEFLEVRCPACGEKKFYRFIESPNRDWMCINPICDMVVHVSTEVKF